MRTKKSAVCTAAIIAAVLMLQITSCATTKEDPRVFIPELEFPVFPYPSSAVLDEGCETVTMSLSDYLRIAEFKVRIDELKAYIDGLKRIYAQDETDSALDKTGGGS